MLRYHPRIRPWDRPYAQSRPRTATPNLIASRWQVPCAGPREAEREPAWAWCALVQELMPPHRSATVRSAADAAHAPFSAVPVQGGSAVPGGIRVLRGCEA